VQEGRTSYALLTMLQQKEAARSMLPEVRLWSREDMLIRIQMNDLFERPHEALRIYGNVGTCSAALIVTIYGGVMCYFLLYKDKPESKEERTMFIHKHGSFLCLALLLFPFMLLSLSRTLWPGMVANQLRQKRATILDRFHYVQVMFQNKCECNIQSKQEVNIDEQRPLSEEDLPGIQAASKLAGEYIKYLRTINTKITLVAGHVELNYASVVPYLGTLWAVVVSSYHNEKMRSMVENILPPIWTMMVCRFWYDANSCRTC